MNVRFVNAGVPGDTVYGGYAGKMLDRVQRDVAPFKPEMITVMLGMNDGGYVPESAKMDAVFQSGYHDLLDALRKAAPGANVTLISPSPYDETTHGTEFPGYSEVLTKNAGDVREIAAQLQAGGDKTILLADAYAQLNEALRRAKAQFPALAPLIIPDRIHPGDIGHWIMATALLSAWHVDPIVSRVHLNAGTAQVVNKDRSTITKLAKTDAGLHWTELDEALPLPLDLNNAMTPVLLQISEIASFDQLILQVDSLDPGNYQLSIDGKMIAGLSSKEMEHGVNLALYKTPMLDQARNIDWSEQRLSALNQAAFILSAEVKPAATTAIAEARLRDAQDEMAAELRNALPPAPHQFELRRQ
jgi:lysophospholipase L1-like esterase